MARYDCLENLEENSKELYLTVTTILLKLMDNVLLNPLNPKYRKLRLDNATIANTMLPAVGAMECLFEIGFEEGSDCLVLPESTPLNKMQQFRSALSLRREKHLKDGVKSLTKQQNAEVDQLVQPRLIENSDNKKKLVPLLEHMQTVSEQVCQHEDPTLQIKALACVPIDVMWARVEQRLRAVQRYKPTESLDEAAACERIRLLELMDWFKTRFFTWVDSPPCPICGHTTTFVGISGEQGETAYTSRVEVYACGDGSCGGRANFPRLNDAGRLLETRRGRCGEWARCFTLLCRALGWQARYISDQTDHAWTEVYSECDRRWLHCDPCECAVDTPLMYEAGWGKQLTYVLAFSAEEVQDVTWRYSAHHRRVMARRTACSEEDLLCQLTALTLKRQAAISTKRRAYLRRRQLAELVELLSEPKVPEGGYGGRTSGALAWRLSRGEADCDDNQAAPYVWKVNAVESTAMSLRVCYSASRDEYKRNDGTRLSGWLNGAWQASNVCRKEEHDWNMTYLARRVGSDKGLIKWQFDVSESGLIVDQIRLTCKFAVYEDGQVTWLLCGSDKCITVVADGEGEWTSAELRGSQSVTLSAELSGGQGEVAWQHAQLFRQPMAAGDFPFDITIMLRQPGDL